MLLVSLNGPVHDLSDYYLFSVHMVQHLVLTLLFPPLLLAGIPGWLLRPLLIRPGCCGGGPVPHPPVGRGPPVQRFDRRLAPEALLRPHDAKPRGAHRHPPDVHGDGDADVVAGHEPAAGAPRLPTGLGMLYLFLVGIPMQIVAALITFADEVLYPWYVDRSPHLGALSARRPAARRADHVDSGQSLHLRGDRGAVLQVGEGRRKRER